MFYQPRTQHHPSIRIPQQQESSPHCNSFLPVFTKDSKTSEYVDFRDAEELDFETDYGEDIFTYLLDLENTTLSSPFYMEKVQKHISWKMRKTLVVWLMEVHKEYSLRPETLYLAINLLDRFCSVQCMDKFKYQLLGIVCLWIAAKYEENHGRVPSLKNLVYMCCSSYAEKEFITMETLVLRVLAFDLGHTTRETFLKRFIKLNCFSASSGNPDIATDGTMFVLRPEIGHLARYLLNITVAHKRFLHGTPSILAHSCLLLANYIITNGTSNTLPFYNSPSNGKFLSKHVVEDIDTFKGFLIDVLHDPPKLLYDAYANLDRHRVSVIAEHWIGHRKHNLHSIPPLLSNEAPIHLLQKELYQRHVIQNAAFPNNNTALAFTPSNMFEGGLLTPPKEASDIAFTYPQSLTQQYISPEMSASYSSSSSAYSCDSRASTQFDNHYHHVKASQAYGVQFMDLQQHYYY